MIACINPTVANAKETLSTLRYASRAKKIKNKPKINEDPKDALLRSLSEEIERLKRLLAEKGLSSTGSALPIPLPSPTTPLATVLSQVVVSYTPPHEYLRELLGDWMAAPNFPLLPTPAIAGGATAPAPSPLPTPSGSSSSLRPGLPFARSTSFDSKDSLMAPPSPNVARTSSSGGGGFSMELRAPKMQWRRSLPRYFQFRSTAGAPGTKPQSSRLLSSSYAMPIEVLRDWALSAVVAYAKKQGGSTQAIDLIAALMSTSGGFSGGSGGGGGRDRSSSNAAPIPVSAATAAATEAMAAVKEITSPTAASGGGGGGVVPGSLASLLPGDSEELAFMRDRIDQLTKKADRDKKEATKYKKEAEKQITELNQKLAELTKAAASAAAAPPPAAAANTLPPPQQPVANRPRSKSKASAMKHALRSPQNMKPNWLLRWLQRMKKRRRSNRLRSHRDCITPQRRIENR